MSVKYNTMWCTASEHSTQFTTDFLYISIPYLSLSQSRLYSQQSMRPYPPLPVIFLPVSGWLSNRTPINLCSCSFKVKISLSMARNVIFICLGKNYDIWRPEPNRGPTPGQTTIKPITPRHSRRNTGKCICIWPLLQPCAK